MRRTVSTHERRRKGLNNWNYGSVDGRRDREQYSAGVFHLLLSTRIIQPPLSISLARSNFRPTLSRSFSLVHRRATSKIIILSQVRFNRGGAFERRLACMPRNRGRMCFTRYIMHVKREQERVRYGGITSVFEL